MKNLLFISLFVFAIMSLTANEQWKKTEGGKAFTFRLPPDLIDQKVQGMDSVVGQYKNDTIILSFDYGMYSDPLTSYSKKADYQESEIKIDGRVAKRILYKNDAIKGFTYMVGIHITDLTKNKNEKLGKPKLTMTAYCKDKKDVKIAEEIFGTIKFEIETKDNILKLFGSKANFEIVQKYEKVSVYKRREAPVGYGGKFDVVDLSKVQADKLVELLSEEKNYLWENDVEKCSYGTRISLDFKKGDQEVRLAFCFNCRTMFLGDQKANVKKSFDPMHSPLTKLIKEFFPKDKDDNLMQN